MSSNDAVDNGSFESDELNGSLEYSESEAEITHPRVVDGYVNKCVSAAEPHHKVAVVDGAESQLEMMRRGRTTVAHNRSHDLRLKTKTKQIAFSKVKSPRIPIKEIATKFVQTEEYRVKSQ